MVSDEELFPNLKEFEPQMLLAMEKEVLGLYISGHPLDGYSDDISRNVNFNSTYLQKQDPDYPYELEDNEKNGQDKILRDDMKVTAAGIIISKKTKITRNSSLMAFITIEDIYGQVEAIIFPKILSRYSDIVAEENIILLKGRLDLKEDEQAKIICEEIRPLKKNRNSAGKSEPPEFPPEVPPGSGLTITFGTNTDKIKKEAIYAALSFFSGNVAATVVDPDSDDERTKKQYKVSGDQYFMNELKQMSGNENVILQMLL